LSASSSPGADVPDPSAPAEPLADAPAVPEAVEKQRVEKQADEKQADEKALPPRKLKLFGAVALAVLAADQLTKSWAVANLDGGRIVDVVGSLRFELAYNTGASFSLGSGRGIGPWVTVIALGMVLVLALGSTSRSTAGAVAAGLIGGGAVGNLVDRAFRGDEGFLHGAVIDFINLQWWPVFNIADMGVVVGALLLVVVGLRAP
jgi:signal peptidase II